MKFSNIYNNIIWVKQLKKCCLAEISDIFEEKLPVKPHKIQMANDFSSAIWVLFRSGFPALKYNIQILINSI